MKEKKTYNCTLSRSNQSNVALTWKLNDYNIAVSSLPIVIHIEIYFTNICDIIIREDKKALFA